MPDLTSRVTILAVGVSHYVDDNFNDLSGPSHDLDNLRKILIENPKTALFNPSQYKELHDPESEDLRFTINKLITDLSPDRDILIFYFSGHGVPIGLTDFGFCTSDTIIHPKNGITLPLSVVKFSELLNSFNIANIIPIVIIDACYSGIAGQELIIPPVDAISSMQDHVHSIAAGSYALLCACSATQTTIDTETGGLFSHFLVEIALQGFPLKEINKAQLSLTDIYPSLSTQVLSQSGDIYSRLYLGNTLPEFSFIKNSQYKNKRIPLSPSYIKILELLWNNGNEQSLIPAEIGKLCKPGSYCNQSKLSLPPWNLVETIPGTRKRRLTERGRQFMLGKLQVPKTIVKNPINNEFVAAEDSKMISYQVH